jgi:hypothetical protein
LAGAALIVSIYALVLASSANRVAEQVGKNQMTFNTVQTIATLKGTSDELRDRFKRYGIDDTARLASFFHSLGDNRQRDAIPLDFYETEIREWCSITRQAHDKLKIAWIDNASFRETYKNTPWFMDMLAKLVGTGPDDKTECL